MAKKEHKPLTKSQLMSHLSEKSGVPKKDIVAIWEELSAVAYKEAKKEKWLIKGHFCRSLFKYSATP